MNNFCILENMWHGMAVTKLAMHEKAWAAHCQHKILQKMAKRDQKSKKWPITVKETKKPK